MGDARDDWAILRALSEVVGKPLPYDSTDGVRSRLADVSPHFAEVDSVQTPIWLNGEYFKVWLPILSHGTLQEHAITAYLHTPAILVAWASSHFQGSRGHPAGDVLWYGVVP